MDLLTVSSLVRHARGSVLTGSDLARATRLTASLLTSALAQRSTLPQTWLRVQAAALNPEHTPGIHAVMLLTVAVDADLELLEQLVEELDEESRSRALKALLTIANTSLRKHAEFEALGTQNLLDLITA